MTDCAKNIIILKPEESFKVCFTKFSGVLKEKFTRRKRDNLLRSQFLFDGVLPIDIRKPIFEEFNMHLFKKEQDESAFSIQQITGEQGHLKSL